MPDLVDRKIEILPSGTLRNPKKVVLMRLPHATLNMQPLFCINCGADGGWVPEDSDLCNYASYLCTPCAEGPLGKMLAESGVYMEPDAVFWAKVAAAQMEQDGRYLTVQETVEALKDSTHYLSKLATERQVHLNRSRQ